MSRLTAKRTSEDPYGWHVMSPLDTYVFFPWERDDWPAQLAANEWTVREVGFESSEDEAAFRSDFGIDAGPE